MRGSQKGKETLIEKVKKAMLAMTRQCWEQGIVASALYELGDTETVDLIVKDMIRRQSPDGRLCNVEDTPAVTDSSFCIPAVYFRGKELGKDEWIAAAKRNIDFLVKDAEAATDKTLYHMKGTKQVWADSAAYLPYTLALFGYENLAISQMEGIRGRLFDPKSGLYFHMWDDEIDGFLRPLPWAIGNGWIMSGMIRLYEVLGDSQGEYKETLKKEIERLLQAVLCHETAQHGFLDILDASDSFEESEAAALFAYSIYYGISLGILDSNYRQKADEIAGRLETKIAEDGEITDAASSPDFVRPGVSVECQANYILMKLMKKRRHDLAAI